jgi:GT2 family glycosyltransferase
VANVTAVICTRDRPARLRGALAALERQTRQDFGLLVVDQSSQLDPDLIRRARTDPRFAYLHDLGAGLSRSRNLASRTAGTEWLAFIDDDCILEPDWIEQLDAVISEHPAAGFVTGHVSAGAGPAGDHLPAAARPVRADAILHGRWTRPERLGFGVCMVVRRSVIVGLGGWDERFGAGTSPFPAAEDVDFNYRFLRGGGVGVATSRLRAQHDQWRSPQETKRLYRGYAVAGAAFPVKHLRTGDIRGGLWLWWCHLVEVVRLLGSGVRHRSPLRVRVAALQLAGILEGTVQAMRRQW